MFQTVISADCGAQISGCGRSMGKTFEYLDMDIEGLVIRLYCQSVSDLSDLILEIMSESLIFAFIGGTKLRVQESNSLDILMLDNIKVSQVLGSIRPYLDHDILCTSEVNYCLLY